MIYDELKNYLIQISSPETVSLFDDAIKVFEKYSVPDYMNIFDTTIGESSDSDSVCILDNLLADLRMILTHLLTIQGISVIEDITISMLTTIADTLFELPYYIDKVTLIDIMSMDINDNEKVCLLLPLLSEHSTEVYLPLIVKVNEYFIENFKNQIKIIQETSVSHEMIKMHVNAYRQFRERIVSVNSHYCDKFFIQIESIGLPYADYIRQYAIDRKEELHNTEQVDIDALALDLVGLTTLSSDGVNNPLVAIRGQLSELYHDINITTKIDIAVSKIVMLYTR